MGDNYTMWPKKEKSENEEAQATQEAQKDEAQVKEVDKTPVKEVDEAQVKEVKHKQEVKTYSIEEDVLHSRVSVLVHTIAAFIMGYVSVILHRTMSGWYVGIIGIILLIIIGFAVERAVGKRGFKWWAGNGLFIYLLFWAVAWVVFFNLGI